MVCERDKESSSVLIGTSPPSLPGLLQLVPVTRIEKKNRDEQGLLQI